MSELNYREMKWHAEHIPERDCWSVFSDKGFAIATGFREKRSADLIAATPELLRACDAALMTLLALDIPAPSPTIVELRAAIAKAGAQDWLAELSKPAEGAPDDLADLATLRAGIAKTKAER